MIKYYYLLILFLLFAGCSLTDSDQPIPSYLVVNEVSVSTLPAQGAPTHKITDLWVYADNQLIGVFEIPARIPILVNGETTEFQIFPGIRRNPLQTLSLIHLLPL